MSQIAFAQVDHVAASAAHVAHCGFAPVVTGAMNRLIFEFVLAISSFFLDLPLIVPVLMHVVSG